MGTYIGTRLSEKLTGGSGGDVLKDELGGSDTLLGGGGDDVITVTRTSGSAADKILMDGGIGDDRLTFSGGGGPASATLRGGDGHDRIIVARAKSAVVDGGAGNDRIEVTATSAATINAGAGRDYITLDLRGAASGGEYVVTLGAGADVLDIRYTDRAIRVTDFTSDDPGIGDLIDLSYFLVEQLKGWDMHTNPFVTGHLGLIQRGASVVLRVDYDGGGNSWNDLVIMDNRTLSSFQYEDRGITGYAPDLSAPDSITKTGGSGNDKIEGRSGDDRLSGLGGDDSIWASFGHDTIDGGSGNDTLNGWAGNDRIIGGAGNDVMTGSYGDDVFVFAPGSGRDVITDFVAGGAEDRLDLTAMKAAGVTWKIAQVGGDAVISFSDGGSVTLMGVRAAELQMAGSFIH